MARAKRNTEASTEETEEETPRRGARSQMGIHNAMVEWLEEEKEYDFDNMTPGEVIAAGFAHRVEWRQTDQYQEVKAAERQKREDEKETRAQRRAEAAEKRKAEKAEADKAKKASKASKEDAPAKKATKRKGRSKAESTEEDPFE